MKSVERITEAHEKRLLTYVKLTGLKLGYLLNFGEDMMKRGIARTVNGLPEQENLGDFGGLAGEKRFEQVPSADGVPPLSSRVQGTSKATGGSWKGVAGNPSAL